MDAQQRERAGAAVAHEMDVQGLTAQQVADMSGVAVVTVRDLCSGKRWPWTSKRNAIELALGWETGRVAQIAKGNAAHPVEHAHRPCDDLTHGLPVEEALSQLLAHSGLTPARRAKVVACYLELVEDQDDQQRTPRSAAQ